MDFDVIVIGGGPAGYVAAIRAAQEGLKTCLIEQKAIGGTCLNVGCVPTKVLLKGVESLDEVTKSEVFGVKLDLQKEPELDLLLLQERKEEIVHQLVYGVNVLLRKNDVEVIIGRASFVDNQSINVDGKILSANNIIIATGSSAKKLSCQTDGSVPIYDSSEILNLKKLPKKMVVVGAGVIGLELAYFLKKCGVEVTVIEFLDGILPMIDQEISEIVKQDFEKLGVDFYLSSELFAIENGRVSFKKQGINDAVETDAVLVSIGRQANISEMNLESLGMKLSKNGIVTDNSLRTNIPHIYAIGDVNGVSMLAHTASMEGMVAVENILGRSIEINYLNIPSVVYIHPELASIGLTEAQAKQKYGKISIGRFPMTANAMAGIQDDSWGMIKVIIEPKYNQILGVHMYCVRASELIASVSVAMSMECTADELAKVVHPHPSVSEALFESYLETMGRAIHN